MASLSYSRIYPRYQLHYPIIFGGAPFIGEGALTNLSFRGCSVLCDREVLCGSDVRVSILLPDQAQALTSPLDNLLFRNASARQRLTVAKRVDR